MRRWMTAAVGAGVAAGVCWAAAVWLAAAPQTPTFRSGVDLIPIDVQVVDGDGHPVDGLTLDQFDVTIDGKKRRVVSVDLIDHRTTSAAPSAKTVTTIAGASDSSSIVPPRRIVIMAIDTYSFDAATAVPILASARAFIEKLPADDEVGLFAYPRGIKIDPTTDHDAIVRALGKIVVQRDAPPEGEFQLTPAELVDLSTWTLGRPTPQASQLMDTLCHGDVTCLIRLDAEVTGGLMHDEAMAQMSAGTLSALIRELGKVPLRKTVVLVSGGFVTADVPGARPDNQEAGTQVGKTAAAADVSVYTLFIDPSLRKMISAETRSAPRGVPDVRREGDLYKQWLDEFSGRAGGSLFRVASGDGHFAFDRILSETSAYYLLGVESTPGDRDGRAHEMRVRVRDKRLTVRGRSWILPQKPGPAPAVVEVADRPASAPAAATAAASAAPVVPEIRPLADAFDRDDRTAIAKAMVGSKGEAVIRAFREGGDPWPASPRRRAVFALDLAAAGMRVESIFTKREAARLIAEYALQVRQPQPNDPFECAWLRVATEGLEGLFEPSTGATFIMRAAERCPADPRFALAVGVIRDQQVRLGESALAPVREPAKDIPDGQQRALDALAAAAASPGTRDEAIARTAWLHFRAARYADGLKTIETLTTPAPDPTVRYLVDVIRGQLLRALDRPDEASAAFRAALVAWPRGQAAQLALMTLLVNRGQHDEAAALADQIETASVDDTDPWWLYWVGDYRTYSTARAQLRERMQ
ncbi:MAG TPA: VWA domain-containing protein [Vicinamibacterales bacterium]|nr:VWA domain-containing protein [Vicinamibacterales bacterium]